MRTTQKAFAALTAAATLIGLAACGGGSDNASKGSTGDANKAELVFWGWDTGHTMTNLIKDFQKANPGITVKFNNTGTASDTQTALSNAIAAGKGAPDVVMLEDPTVTQFAVTGDLADLSQFGADKLADDFSAGPWNKLQYNNKPYALPIDSLKCSSTTMRSSRRPASTAPRSRPGTTITRPPRRSRQPAPT